MLLAEEAREDAGDGQTHLQVVVGVVAGLSIGMTKPDLDDDDDTTPVKENK